jgi:glycosyltransferase involved in cell wall biosynthesis
MGTQKLSSISLFLLLVLVPVLASAEHSCSADGEVSGSCDAYEPLEEPAAKRHSDDALKAPRNVYSPQRFHVLGIPHTITHKEFSACAFTQKIIVFSKIMVQRGHTVYHYGNELSQVTATEHITVTTAKDLIADYGSIDYWKNWGHWKYDANKDQIYRTFTRRAMEEISTRCQKGDFLLLFFGHAQSAVAEGITRSCPGMIVVEPSIGYPLGNVWAQFRVFESYFYQGSYYTHAPTVGRWYDAVIPSGFELEDFEYSDKKQDFCLYMARLAPDKGANIAIQVTAAAGCKLIMAGQGSLENLGYKEVPPHVEHIGVAGPEQRRQLLRDAKVVLMPTEYLEPYGFVVVEAQLSGTPVVSTDWGAFPETVLHGVTGYRCRTHEQFVWALKNVHRLDHKVIRQWAVNNYAIDVVADKYEEYFDWIARNNQAGGTWYYKYDERESWDLPSNLCKALNCTG